MMRSTAKALVVGWCVLFLAGIAAAIPGPFLVYHITAGYAPEYVHILPFSEVMWDYGGVAFAASAVSFLPGVALVSWLWKRPSGRTAGRGLYRP